MEDSEENIHFDIGAERVKTLEFTVTDRPNIDDH